MLDVRCIACLLVAAHGLDNGVGLLPPMGYNTWNDLGCSVTEDHIRQRADMMVERGLLKAGYTYLNLDDCWQAPARDSLTGRLQGDLTRFPSSIRNLSDYIHAKGLKFGIYTDRGYSTCANRPGSYGHEVLDAQTFADWGVDYVKEDNCNTRSGSLAKPELFERFGMFRDALNSTGRPIYFSICCGGGVLPWANLSFVATDPRGGKTLGNSWRIHADCDEWYTCFQGARVDSNLPELAGQGGFNDPDMLLASGGLSVRRLLPEESRTQFNVWAILMAPLLIGSAFESMSEWDLETFLNEEVIAVNQDPLLKQGFVVKENWSIFGYTWVWARPLSGSSWALVFQNNHIFFPSRVVCDSQCWANLPGLARGSRFDVRDLWKHAPADVPVAVAGEDYSVQLPRGRCSAMFKLSPSPAKDDALLV